MTEHFEMARRMINASICAYNIHAKGVISKPDHEVLRKVTSADGDYYYDVVPFYQDAVGFAGPSADYAPAFDATGSDLIDGALVGLTEDGFAVVSIRGTLPPSFEDHDILEWMTDWREDADMDPVPWAPGAEPYGKVEHGFAKAALALWPFVHQSLDALQGKAPRGVVVTGHSKGGAVTYLIASLIREHFPQYADRIEVHAFAAAVAVNSEFLQCYTDQGLAKRTWRYQVENDLVPFIPLWRHVNVWSRIVLESPRHKLEWGALALAIAYETRGGYKAPGHFVYFDGNHDYVPDVSVTRSALPAVVATFCAGRFKEIGAAHSATQSYHPCFGDAALARIPEGGVRQV